MQIAAPPVSKILARAATTVCVGLAFAVHRHRLARQEAAARVATKTHASAVMEFTLKWRKSWRERRRKPLPMLKVSGSIPQWVETVRNRRIQFADIDYFPARSGAVE